MVSPSRVKFIGLILAAVFCLAAVSLSGFYFWRQGQTADPFFEFAPVDSVLYVSARDSVWPEAKTKISDLPFKEFFKQTAENEIFSRLNFPGDLLALAKRAAFLLVPDENSRLKKVFIFEFEEPWLIPAKFQPDTIFDQNFLVVAETESVLEKIRRVKDKAMFSLSRRRENKKNNGLFFLYASAANLKSYFKAGDEPLNNFFIRQFNDDLFLTLKKKNGVWQFSLKGPAAAGRGWPPPVLVQKPLVESMPKDFSYYFSGLGLNEIFSYLNPAESGSADLNRQTQASFQMIYQKDLSAFIKGIFARPAAAIIFAENKEYAPGFGLVLVMPAGSGGQIKQFEDLTRIFLARKQPVEKERRLLDKSTVTELLAKPDLWQWEEETKDDKQKIRFLSEPDLDFELAYSVKNNKMYLANSRKQLNDFFEKKDLFLNSLVSRCAQANSGRFILFNSRTQPPEFLPYLPAGLVLVKENGKELTGCIIDF